MESNLRVGSTPIPGMLTTCRYAGYIMDWETVRVRLTVGETEVDGAVQLPAAPMPRRILLPVLQRLTDTVVTVGAGEAPVSCRKGCDACCRQMVPISKTEAFGLAESVARMPAPKAQRILARFEEGLGRLDAAGVLDKLLRWQKLKGEDLRCLDRDYFAAGVPCPFLERGACVIHKDRPLACREFLVTSDPAHCRDPGSGSVRQVELGAKISTALAAADGGWLPLILARREVSGEREETLTVKPAEELGRILGMLANNA